MNEFKKVDSPKTNVNTTNTKTDSKQEIEIEKKPPVQTSGPTFFL